MGCLWWWTSKKCDKHLGEEVKAIREDISASMDQLVLMRRFLPSYPTYRGASTNPKLFDGGYFNSALNGRDLPL